MGGVLTVSLAVSLDRTLVAFNVGRWAVLADDLLFGALVAGVIFLYEYRRTRKLRERLRTIEMMNHHVRNALQVIRLMQHVDRDDQYVKRMEDAVARIEWALREILPGTMLRVEEQLHPPKKHVASSRHTA
jgi:chemotaxis regulatin CheY-phosphate phosphatase CheZ